MNEKAAAYARISRDADRDGEGVDNQHGIVSRLAERHGLNIVARFTDNDLGASSLSKKSRPDFQRLLDGARRGEFAYILAYSMSRLTRRPSEWEQLIELAQTYGIQFIYETSPRYDLNTADGRATARTVAAWDAAEAERTGERVRAAKAYGLSQGKDPGGPRPFGWEKDRKTHRPHEAAMIRCAVQSILGGATLMSVAKQWTASDVPPPRAGGLSRGDGKTAAHQWRSQTIRHILANPRNNGRLIVKGVDYGQVAEPIVTDEEYAAILAILNNPARRPKHGPEPERSPAQRLLECGKCGGHFAVARVKGIMTLRCNDVQFVPGGHPTISTAKANRQLGIGALWAILGTQPRSIGPNASGIQTAQVEIAGLKEELERITAAYIAGIGDLDLLARKSAELKGQISEAQARLDERLASGDVTAAVEVAQRYVSDWRADGAEVDFSRESVENGPWLPYWHGLSVPEQRTLLRGLFRSIKLLPYDRIDPGRFEYDGQRLLLGETPKTPTTPTGDIAPF